MEHKLNIPRKSWSCSSLVWILVLWIIARLISELHPRGWEYMFFWGAPIFLGAFPATGFLLLEIAEKDSWLANKYRWLAVAFVCGSFVGALGMPNADRTVVLVIQSGLFLLCIGITMIFRNTKGARVI